MAYFVIAMLAVLRAVVVRFRRPPTVIRRLPYVLAAGPLAVLALVMVLKLIATAYAIHFVVPRAVWESALPFGVAHDNEPRVPYGIALSLAMLCSSAIATTCLALVARGWRSMPRPLVTCVAIVMAAAALTSPVLTSGDAYSNVGYALLGTTAYHPPATPFPAAFHAINWWWNVPMPASPYGPVWLAAISFCTWFAPSLVWKIVALRVLGLSCFGGMLYALFRIDRSGLLTALAAVNPDLWLQLVSNAHADVMAMLFIGVGAVVARENRSPFAFVLLAGLVKAPYVVAGAVLFAFLPDRRRRVGSALAATALCALAYWLAGGASYLSGLGEHARSRATMLWSVDHVSVAVLAFVIVAAAVVARFKIRDAMWTLAALVPGTFPWYTGLAFPYAALSNGGLQTYFVLLPCAMFLMDTVFLKPVVALPFLALAAVFTARSIIGSRTNGADKAANPKDEGTA